MTKTVYLGLGSNLGDRERNLHLALEQLESPDLHIVRASPIYETEPMAITQQPWFLNQVAEAKPSCSPCSCLSRKPARSNASSAACAPCAKGPRTIDIDILLLWARRRPHPDASKIPHPRMAERRFVLAPLADLAPDLRHPRHRTDRARDAGRRAAQKGRPV